MGLTKTQLTILTKAQALGGGDLGKALTDTACIYLVATIARDLGLLKHFPEFTPDFAPFFSPTPPEQLTLPGSLHALFERLMKINQDAETYFSCLAALQKSRLKYYRILERQAVPTMDQVGPRSLLQYGQMSDRSLAGFLQWRKWLFDIDNRAGQETGYLFEPIVAHAIGGVPASAKKSPIRRSSDSSKGRQADCILDKFAYEIKIRVTIAASGQGRWREELEFPVDCRGSGFTPVLIVFDPTPNPKLDELIRAFAAVKGIVYVGDQAWKHLEEKAGPTLSRFIENYVRTPIAHVLSATEPLPPPIALTLAEDRLTFSIGGEEVSYARKRNGISSEDDDLPDDVDEEVPGV